MPKQTLPSPTYFQDDVQYFPPGPQFPLYMLGRRLQEMFPMVPLAGNQALGIAIMSYDGQLNFGLNADYDALGDVELLAQDLTDAIAELLQAAGAVTPGDGSSNGRRINWASAGASNRSRPVGWNASRS